MCGRGVLFECDGKRYIEICAKLGLTLRKGLPLKYRAVTLSAMDLHGVKKKIENAPGVTLEILS